jgi:hypothetical protein
MKIIHTDSRMLKTKGPNQSFGNHLLHLFAIWKISKTLNIELSIDTDSNLDDIFDLSRYKGLSKNDPDLLYTEKYGGTVEDHIKKETENCEFFKKLLNKEIPLPNDFKMEGWFWNSIFLPDDSIFEEFRIIEDLKKEVFEKKYIQDAESLTIHYRGTDFSDHSIGWGDLRLKEEYYEKCISDFSSRYKTSNIVFVGDEHPEFLIQIFKKYCNNIIIEKNDYKLDWLILLFSKNLICSNSSFCYTAGWYRKSVVYQPECFFTRYINNNTTYPLYPYYLTNNSKIL